MHDTKLDQPIKVRVEVKASIAKAKAVPSHKASMFSSLKTGLATVKQPGFFKALFGLKPGSFGTFNI